MKPDRRTLSPRMGPDGKACCPRETSPNAVDLRVGPNLFIDDYLIAASRGLKRTTHQPERRPDPVLEHDRPSPYLSVRYDDALKRYRMWYGAMAPQHGFAYAESRDGITWTLPDLGEGLGNYLGLPFGYWGFSLVDDGPRSADASRRYKIAWYEHPRGMCVAFSPDGLRFRKHDGNPVIPTTLPGSDANNIGDILDICFDPLKREYLLVCKIARDGFPGQPHHIEAGRRRCVGWSASRDFVTWSRPELIVAPDPHNGLEEFYGFKPVVRGNLYIGFLRVLRDDLPATPGGPVEGLGWTELMSSRDGRNWTRYQEPFLARDPNEDGWDHAMAWFGDSIGVGGKEYIYYGGYRAGHKVRAARGDRNVGLAMLRKDGFVSRDAGPEGGVLTTPPAILPGSGMTVNAVVRGELSVRLADRRGRVPSGFDWQDCIPVRGDSLTHRIGWRGDPAWPAGEPMSLEFALRDGELYALDAVPGRT